jgi:copper chaperone
LIAVSVFDAAAQNDIKLTEEVVFLETVTLKVDGMSCSHCVNAITKAVGALKGVSDVKVSLEAGTAEIRFDSANVSLDRIKEEIDDQGYEVAN